MNEPSTTVRVGNAIFRAEHYRSVVLGPTVHFTLGGYRMAVCGYSPKVGYRPERWSNDRDWVTCKDCYLVAIEKEWG